MNREQLFAQILRKRSYLCVGLDTDAARIPKRLLGEPDPVFAFNRAIIDATAPFCVAYKPNTAFYEASGPEGWTSLAKTAEYLSTQYPGHFRIADAKRGDIGNTARQYARAFFDTLGFDAITVAPYMGADSVLPFLERENHWAVLLALTSNTGSADFQFAVDHGEFLFERVLRISQGWSFAGQLMYVVGATHPEQFQRVRALAPDNFFLVPGVGAQGGDLAAISRAGMNRECGLLVNASRSIQYASSGDDFADAAGQAAADLQREMDVLLMEYLPKE